MKNFLVIVGALGLVLGLSVNSYAEPGKASSGSSLDKSKTKPARHLVENPEAKRPSSLGRKQTRIPRPAPKSSNRGTQEIIGAASNSKLTGKQPAQCYTDWGYDRCTDILMMGEMDRHDLGTICSLQSVTFDPSLNHYERGMFSITNATHGRSSWSINYVIFCGEGGYFEGSTHFADSDMDEDKKQELIGILIETITIITTAIGKAHEPFGVPASDLAEALEYDMNRKFEREEKARVWKEAHSEEGTDINSDEDTDSDDDDDNSDADDENAPSLHDGEGCPDNELVFC